MENIVKNHLKKFVLWLMLPLIKLYRILVEEPSIFVCFSENELFQDPESFISQDNPYQRALRPQILKYINFSVVIEKGDILSYKSLAANRLLLTIYEQDFVLLPGCGLKTLFDNFNLFYSSELRGLGALIRPKLEACIFDFLKNEIKESDITNSNLEDVLNIVIKSAQNNTPNPVMEAILSLSSLEDKKNAAKLFLIQLASDFLVESSAMVKNLPGSFGGEIGSELFKVVIDEYGYGVYSKKHSTLFQNTLNSVQLCSGVHDYWQFYLTSSLLLNNYFNWICTDHSKIFRYLGALFFAETSFIKSCQDWAETLNEIFGDEIDVSYFKEHVHIDFYHSRMLKKMVESAVTKHSVEVIPEIIRGIKEAEQISKIADDDLIRQIQWINSTSTYKEYGKEIYKKIYNNTTNTLKYQEFVEKRDVLSVTHVHDKDELCYIVKGEMKFVTGPDTSEVLKQGEAIVILHNRLHGAIITSEECVYRIYTIGDYKKWLN